jgi:hypothetical protein
MLPTRRRRLFVDFKLQGALLVHTLIYWLYCLLSVSLIALCWIIFVQRPETSSQLFSTLWMNFGPALIGSLVLLPIVLMDCLRLSNRFAGPMVRIQSAMKQLADGETAAPVHLRDHDFWHEFSQNLNRVIADSAKQTESSDEGPARPTTGLDATSSSPKEASHSDVAI